MNLKNWINIKDISEPSLMTTADKIPQGVRHFENLASEYLPQYAGVLRSGCSVYLKDDQYVDLDIPYALGPQQFERIAASGGGGVVDNGGGSYTINAQDVEGGARLYSYIPINDLSIKEFTVTQLTGTMEMYYWTGFWSKQEIVLGVNVIPEFSTADLNVEIVGVTGSESLTLNDIKFYEITNTNSYMTFTHPDTHEVETIDALPASTTYRMTESFNNCFMTDVPVTQNDRDLIKAEPEIVLRLFFGATTGLSFLKTNIKHFYPGSEGPLGAETVFDLV